MDNSYVKPLIDSTFFHDVNGDNLTEIPFHLFEFLSSGDCNKQNLCRTCLTTDNKLMFPLFSTKDISFANMFTALTAMEISPRDGLPSNICPSCRNRIVSSYNFKLQCEKSTRILNSVMKCFTKDESVDNMNVNHVPGINNAENVDIKQEKDILKSEDEDMLTDDFPERNNYSNKKSHVFKGKGIAFNAKVTAGNNVHAIKEEPDVSKLDDVEYLDDDVTSEDNTLSTLPDISKRKETEVTVTVTDSDTFLQEIVCEKKISKKTKRKTYSCKICYKNFYKTKLLRAHLKNNHQLMEQEFPCNQCKDTFASDHDLKLHLSLHSKDASWSCNKCDKVFESKTLLRRHIHRHMESKRYSCETCGKLFTELYALKRHARVHTGETMVKKYKCHLCDKKYSESGQLAAHIARHEGLRPCVCSVCGKAFPSARLLTSHKLTHSDAKPFACTYCDKRFRHESTRNIHHRTHTGEKPYVCSACGKTFIQNSNLTLHMRTHTGEKPYACSMCSRKFSSGSSLKTHERTHTGERPYECNICSNKFARSNLRVHMRLHTGERPYPCNMCPKKFVSAARLREHSRAHTGEKPFECAMCSKKFPTKSYLVRHMKKHQSAGKSAKIKKTRKEEHVVSGVVLKSDKKQREEVTNENVAEADCGAIVFDIKEVPIEVGEELVLEDDNVKTEMLVIDGGPNYQTDNILNANGVIVGDLNYANNLVAVNEGDGSVSTSGAILEGATVKLYQLDQSLLQIHSAGGQLTISKITSKMTANF